MDYNRTQSTLGEFYRRMRAKLGAPKAITVTAHNSLASYITCSLLANHTTRPSLPNGSDDTGSLLT